jgi:hypothetical protein
MWVGNTAISGRVVGKPSVTELGKGWPSFAGNRCLETLVLPEWNGVGDCFLCLLKKPLQRDYPRNPTKFEARLADEPAFPALPVPTTRAGGFLVSLSSEE